VNVSSPRQIISEEDTNNFDTRSNKFIFQRVRVFLPCNRTKC